MNRQSVSTSPAPEVYIDEILGELQVKGWGQDEVEVKAAQDDLELEEQDDVVHIRCRGNCAVRLPSEATLRVGQVMGDARFKLLEDQLQIETINGSLILKNVAETQIGVVNGDLAARAVQGDLSAEDVRGNVSARDIQGECRLNEVGGNADIREVEGSLQVRAHGNAWVRLSALEGDAYEIRAHGNAYCRIPGQADVALSLTSGAQNIRLRLASGSQDVRQGRLETTLGSGSIPMEVFAAGNLSLTADEDTELEGEAAEETFSPFDQDFSRQIDAQVEAITRRIDEQLSRLTDQIGRMGLPDQEAEDMMQQARVSGERAAARAEERMRRAQERLERKLENTRRRNEQKSRAADRRTRRSWSFEFSSPPAPPPPPAPPGEPVSDDERLMILRMLEQKKISLEEAEALLASLEGREG